MSNNSLCTEKEYEAKLTAEMSEEAIKAVGEDIAEVVRVHKLVKRPDVCRALFSYMSDVVDGWNSV